MSPWPSWNAKTARMQSRKHTTLGAQERRSEMDVVELQSSSWAPSPCGGSCPPPIIHGHSRRQTVLKSSSCCVPKYSLQDCVSVSNRERSAWGSLRQFSTFHPGLEDILYILPVDDPAGPTTKATGFFGPFASDIASVLRHAHLLCPCYGHCGISAKIIQLQERILLSRTCVSGPRGRVRSGGGVPSPMESRPE
jgi:hypothetical protein